MNVEIAGAIEEGRGRSATASKGMVIADMRGFSVGASATGAALSVAFSAIGVILVPYQLSVVAPAEKELALAVTASASSIVTVLVHPLIGDLSDRTRSRLGRRSPWMLGGAILGGAALLVLGSAQTAVAVAVGWIIVQPLLNAVDVPLAGAIADRVRRNNRPRTAGYVRSGTAAGLIFGAATASNATNNVFLMYATLATLLVVVTTLFIVLYPDPNRGPVSAQPLSVKQVWTGPALRRVFSARFAVALGNQLIVGFLLYVVMAYTGTSGEEAAPIAAVLITVHLGCLILAAVVTGHLVGTRRVPWVVTATVVIGVGLIVPIATPGFLGLVGYAIIAGLGRGVYASAGLALALDLLPATANHGRDMGIFGLTTVIPQAVAPAIAGVVLLAAGGDYRMLFAVGAVCVAISLIAIFRARDTTSVSQ